jgi:uncharacterized sulfatase
MLGKRRLRVLLMLLGAAGAVMGAARPGRAESEQPPNIVLILADDMGWHQLACYGNSFYQTPSVDALAGQGMRFTDAYAAAPVCSPTRASLMTGKYPARLHITDYIPGSPFPFNRLKTPIMAAGLPLEEETIPEMLARAGYVSGHFGKWHLNKDKAYAPGRPGDPRSQGFSDVLTTKKPTEPEGAQAGADPDYDAHHVREITDRSLAFMKANRDRPFFCYITHNSIHRPIMEFAPSILQYAVKPEASNKMGNNPVIGAMVETLDRSVQRVLDCIDELEMADQTIVIFYSDNGALFGREGLKPLFGAKADLYEGGVRVPLIVRWPGVVKPGTVSNEPVSTIDFLPTFAKIAGLQVTDPTVDGVSFLPALTESGPLGRDALYWHYPHYHHQGVAPSGSIREGRYKLIEWFEKSRLEGAQADGALLLFDLEADPGERRNLAAAMPDRARRMYQKLVAWRKNVGAQEMTPNPDHDPEREGFKGAADH